MNIGSGHAVAVREIVESLGAITGRPDLVELGALPYAEGDPMLVEADNRRLTVECGFTPQWSFSDGLRDTVRWWSEQQ